MKLSRKEKIAMLLIVAGVILLIFGGWQVFCFDIVSPGIPTGAINADPMTKLLYLHRYGNSYLGICLLGLGALLDWREDDRREKQMAHY